MTDDAIACDVKFNQIERKGRKFSYTELSIDVIR